MGVNLKPCLHLRHLFVCCVLRLFNKTCSETLENVLDFVFQTAVVVSVKVLHVLNKRVVFLYSKIIILKSYLLFMCYCGFYFKTEFYRLGLFLMLEVECTVPSGDRNATV